MTIILFLLDTSASMNQRTYLGTSLMDTAKSTVELFMRIRQRDPNSRGDRYMLLTFEEPPLNVKSGWRENHATFVHELKNLQAKGLTTTGDALRHAFDLLNVNRMTSMIDTYGQGRCPFYLEPCVLIVITDGQRLTTMGGISDELTIPTQSPLPGSELTKEPFRWDQRLFAICLRIPGSIPHELPNGMLPSDNSPVDAMCDVTGGRSYCITYQRQLNQCVESLVQKVQPGVVINFQKVGADPPPPEYKYDSSSRSDTNSPVISDGLRYNNEDSNGPNKENADFNLQPPEYNKRPSTPTLTSGSTAWHNVRKLIYVQKSAQKGYSVGHWPIPEAFWPDLNSPTLPPRSAHPIVQFSCTSCDAMVIDNLPFDKYELEPSPLTQYILERKQPHVAWQVFVQNSAKHSEVSHPFGYLKASTALNCVNLFVMPYNYPVLLPLLEEFFKVHKMKPPLKWRTAFDNYLKTMPVYYAGPLRRAIHRMGSPNLVPDNLDNCLSYSVLSYLKKVKFQAKVEYDRLVNSVGQNAGNGNGDVVYVTPRSPMSLTQHKDIADLLHNVTAEKMANLKSELNEFSNFVLHLPDKSMFSQSYRNPFDIPRKNLLDQIARMRGNFLQSTLSHTKLLDDDQMHTVPISQMGNYQDHLKNLVPPLREIDSTPVRQHMFGNPFKVDKRMMVDEADVDLVSMPKDRKRSPSETSATYPGPKRRKPGPLSPDVPYRRSPSPAPSPLTSPVHEMEAEVLNESAVVSNEKQVAESDDVFTVQKEAFELSTEVLTIDISEPSDVVANHIKENSVDVLNGETLLVDGLTNHVNELHAIELCAENRQLRRVIFKEIRKPGRNFDKLFDELNKMQGNLSTRLTFLKDVSNEAERYKRRRLVEMLQEFKISMIKYEEKAPSVTSSPNKLLKTNS